MSIVKVILVSGSVVKGCALVFTSGAEVQQFCLDLQAIYGVVPTTLEYRNERREPYFIPDVQQWLKDNEHLLPKPKQTVKLHRVQQEPVTSPRPTRSTPVPDANLPPQPAFDLIVLDFDQTMAFTTPLDPFREKPTMPEDWETALDHTEVNETIRTWLTDLQRLANPPRLAVISAARRWYLQDLLHRWFPGVPFISVLGYEDALAQGRCFKPNPTLLQQLLTAQGVAPDRTLVIGDSEKDVEMAFRAGTKVMQVNFYSDASRQYRAINGLDTKDNSYFHALRALPHAVCTNAGQLDVMSAHLDAFDLPLEALQAGVPAENLRREPWHFTLKAFPPEGGTSIDVVFLGRYCTAPNPVKRIHSLPMRATHQLTKQILLKEEGISEVPPEWVEAVSVMLRRWGNRPTVLTIIPSKVNRPRRNEQLLNLLYEEFAWGPNFIFDPEVFQFTADAESNKTKNQAGREENLNQHMFLHPQAQLHKGQQYIVLDDVSTTGQTFLRARDLLRENGIHSAKYLSIAKSHSFKEWK